MEYNVALYLAINSDFNTTQTWVRIMSYVFSVDIPVGCRCTKQEELKKMENWDYLKLLKSIFLGLNTLLGQSLKYQVKIWKVLQRIL